jgi:hypothetical protein
MDGYILFIVFILAAIAFAVYNWYAAAERRKGLAAWALANDLEFHPANRYGLDNHFPEFDCLRQGDDDNRYAYNVMEGDWHGRKLLAFDYHYETHTHSSKGGRQTHHHHFSAVVLRSDMPLKPLFIRPEGWLDKLAEFVGVEDINFESAEFSRRFYVKSPDKKWAYDVIHQRTMEFLLNSPVFSLSLGLMDVIAYRNETFSPQDFQAAAEVTQGILDRFPDYLVRQQREGLLPEKGTA